MCAVGAFSACEMLFCTYFTYYVICITIYFEIYVYYACYFMKRRHTYLNLCDSGRISLLIPGSQLHLVRSLLGSILQ